MRRRRHDWAGAPLVGAIVAEGAAASSAPKKSVHPKRQSAFGRRTMVLPSGTTASLPLYPRRLRGSVSSGRAVKESLVDTRGVTDGPKRQGTSGGDVYTALELRDFLYLSLYCRMLLILLAHALSSLLSRVITAVLHSAMITYKLVFCIESVVFVGARYPVVSEKRMIFSSF